MMKFLDRTEQSENTRRNMTGRRRPGEESMRKVESTAPANRRVMRPMGKSAGNSSPTTPESNGTGALGIAVKDL